MSERSYAVWYVWARRNLGGGARVCHAAAAAAAETEAAGASREEAIRAARAGTTQGLHLAEPSTPARTRAYAEWYDWSRREFGGVSEQQHAAAAAALAALDSGHPAVAAAESARAAFEGGAPAPAAYVPPDHTPLPEPSPQPAPTSPDHLPAGQVIAYAAFWRRVGAWVVDALVLAGANLIIGVVIGLVAGVTGVDVNSSSGVTVLLYAVTVTLNLFYFAGFESSVLEATPGKALLGLRVVDRDGLRLSPGRAVGRTLAKYLSTLTLGVGWLLAAFTARRQALHDLVAGTLVLSRRPESERAG